MRDQLISSDKKRVVVGLGKTGLACARWLYKQGVPFLVVDTRDNPPGLDAFHKECSGIDLICGPLDSDLLSQADELIVSPGLSLKELAIAAAMANGAAVVGDVELFCQKINVPVIAITGSNGKSTVTTLVGLMAEKAGIRVGTGGNIGTPVLDLFEQGEKDLYVLELSSFQLETTHTLRAVAATVLNVTPDHMDRYNSLAEYHQAKHRIFRGCKGVVINRDDALTSPLVAESVKCISFGLGRAAGLNDFGIEREQERTWLTQGLTRLIATDELKIKGSHNYANALAALALGSLAGLPVNAMLDALREFTGLPHRCEWVKESRGVSWFNDSKATNTGSAIAAIEGLGCDIAGKVILIAGGEGKGADFSVMKPAIEKYARSVIVIGADGPRLADAACEAAPILRAGCLDEAIHTAAELAHEGDVVLLAPACASFDMFNNYEHRGEVFKERVGVLCD